MSEPIFTNWRPDDTRAWAEEPVRLAHRLDRHPIFSLSSLADLIDGYPRAHYSLVEMGPQGSNRRLWREGDLGGLKGTEVIEAIRRGRMWLNLRNVGKIHRAYGEALREIFAEIQANVPGYETYDQTSGILISSPKAQVYYHMDLPGQSLWQIHGRKRVFVYPNRAPYLTPEELERIALYEVEVDVPYNPAWDKAAAVFEIGGGEMLHWPLNAPHKVENLDSLNVSMTTEYWTEAIRRSQIVNLANGILRDKLGFAPSSRSTSGPGFWAKAALQAGVRRAGLLQRDRKGRRAVEFRLDRSRLGAVVDLPQAAE
jgi:hypothetical protein